MRRASFAIALALLVTLDAAAGPVTPTEAPPARRRVVQVAAGNWHTCVRFADGAVRCWGRGDEGALGRNYHRKAGVDDKLKLDEHDPRDIGDDEPALAAGDVTLNGPATFVAAGGAHTCAILEGGRINCWGLGVDNILGYGNENAVGDDETPADAGPVPVGDSVISLSAGFDVTCAVLPAGRLRCWGAYTFGRKDPCPTCRQWPPDEPTWRSINSDKTPAQIGDLAIGGGEKVAQVACRDGLDCLRFESGGVRCWAEDPQLGTMGHLVIELPSQTDKNIELGGKATQIAVGLCHACALMRGGNVRCWGTGDQGALGYGNGEMVIYPKQAGDVPIGGRVTQIAAGDFHTCALLTTGKVRCWGQNDRGQLGYGHTRTIGDKKTPAAAGNVDVGGRVVQITAGGKHTCALLATGGVRCWGENDFGQLGYGHTRNIGDDEKPASAGDVPLQ